MNEIKDLIEQLSQACESLEDQELKNKLLPLIEQFKALIPESAPEVGMEEADKMMENKNFNIMDTIAGSPIKPENTP